MAFLTTYDELATQITDPEQLAVAQAGLVGTWLAERPLEMFAELRPERPIFRTPRSVIVTRYADVLEVLHADAAFSETLYAPRMKRIHVDFFLGMRDTSQYEREASIMRLVASRSDLSRIQSLVEEHSNAIVEALKPAGRLDLVADLSRVVPLRFIQQYFGVSGPSDEALKQWTRALFWDLFANLSNAPEVIAAADQAAIGLKADLEVRIAQRKAAIAAGLPVPDDVLTRLLSLQSADDLGLDDDGIRRNLSGLAIGAVETTSGCVANVINALLDRPEALQAAREAAQQGLDALLPIILEALRFSPQHEFLYRLCTTDYAIARGTSRETVIPRGSFVIAAVASAMFDETVVDEPDTFRPGRPADNYVLFGAGRHACFGRHINLVQIPAICRSLLRLPGLRRAEGPDGELQFEGPFPNRCILEFDAS